MKNRNILQRYFISQTYGDIETLLPLQGGSINQAFKVTTQSQNVFFLKFNDIEYEQMFESESTSLSILNKSNTFKIPRTYLVNEHFLLLEFIELGEKSAQFWEEAGRNLAELHKITHTHHGFDIPNYIGTTEQYNMYNSDGFDFFKQNRLEYQLKIAVDNNLIHSALANNILYMINHIENYIPNQPASLLHGDLWSGNIFADSNNEPVIIDPACYYGFRESDIAMTTLFGAFPNQFYDSYIESYPLEPNWRDRCEIYNLYHLLNHLNMFGLSYLNEIQSIVKRYVS